MANNKKKHPVRTLLAVICNGPSCNDARSLLKNNTGQDARNPQDLELKLATFYRDTENKRALEEELAKIHPHKDFILKYMAPKPAPTITVESELKPIVEKVSGSDGRCYDETQKMSGFSNASGEGQSNFIKSENYTPLIIGTAAILTIFCATITVAYLYKNK